MTTGKFQFSLFCLILATLIQAPRNAAADLVDFRFTGVVTTVDPELAGEFSVNESVQGTFTFDTLTSDLSGSSTIGFYASAITNVAVTFGGDYTVGQNVNSDIYVLDDALSASGTADSFDVFVDDPSAASVASHPLSLLVVALMDTDATVFSSDDLPSSPPTLSLFENDDSFMRFLGPPPESSSQPAEFFVDFRLTSLTTAVPEPSAFLFGCLVVAVAAASSYKNLRWPFSS